MKLKYLLYSFWPPLEAWATNDYIDKQQEGLEYNKLLLDYKSNIVGKSNELLISIAKGINENEKRRKETIENKASTYIIAIGLSLTIVSVVTTFLNRKSELVYLMYPALIALFAAIIYLFVSTYYAIQVRQVKGFYLLSTYDFNKIISDKNSRDETYIATLITNSKMNQNTLLKMANFLSVAEELFLRGIALIAFSSILMIGSCLI